MERHFERYMNGPRVECLAIECTQYLMCMYSLFSSMILQSVCSIMLHTNLSLSRENRSRVVVMVVAVIQTVDAVKGYSKAIGYAILCKFMGQRDQIIIIN